MVLESTRPLEPAGQIAGTPWRTLRTLAASNGLLLAVLHTRTSERRSLWLLPRRSACASSASLPPHERLVRVLGGGRTAQRASFLVLEELHGELLSERLRRTGPLHMPAAVEVAACLFEALAALHAAGLCHGEVSAGVVFALDHGRAKLLCATPRAASPHVLRDDVRRAAFVLFEALTGRLPLADAPTWQDGKPPAWRSAARLHDALPGVAPELSSLVSGLLSADPPAAGLAAARLRRLLVRRLAVPADAPTVVVRYDAPTRVEEPITDTDELPTRVLPALDAPTIVDPPRAGFCEEPEIRPALAGGAVAQPRTKRAPDRTVLLASALASFVMSCFAVLMVTVFAPKPAVPAPRAASTAAATPSASTLAAAIGAPLETVTTRTATVATGTSANPPPGAPSATVAGAAAPPPAPRIKAPPKRARRPQRSAPAPNEADAACITARGLPGAGL